MSDKKAFKNIDKNNKNNKNNDKNNDKNINDITNITDIKDMTIDNIIINLKIIALIKKHEKLSVQDNSLIIDDHTNIFYIQSITRWINDDNRQKTMEYIDKIIQKTFEFMDKVYDDYKSQENPSNKNKQNISEEIFEEDKESLLLRLSKEIINAAEGLKNLRQTYKNDSLVNSQIQLLLDKIKIKVEKINVALNVKWIIDKEYHSNNNYGT